MTTEREHHCQTAYEDFCDGRHVNWNPLTRQYMCAICLDVWSIQLHQHPTQIIFDGQLLDVEITIREQISQATRDPQARNRRHHRRHPPAPSLEDLLRADAAAVIDDDLD